MMYQHDVEMLNQIYRNASMGIRGTELLIDKTDDSGLSCELHKFLTDYTNIQENAASMLEEYGVTPRDTGIAENTGLWMGVQLNTLFDKTPSHMAEMLIQGSTAGIIKGTQDLNSNMEATQGPRKLAERLIKLEQQNIEAMKHFLS